MFNEKVYENTKLSMKINIINEHGIVIRPILPMEIGVTLSLRQHIFGG